MESGRASRTAEQNALFRALEARRPAARRIVGDPHAELFLSWPYRIVAAAGRWQVWNGFAARFIDRRWPGVRPTVIARTRAIDSLVVAEAPVAGQVVILGAGLDTRAWRLDALAGRTVFEVDHPDTQRHKRARLRSAGLDVSQVRFVGTDFNLDQLGEVLARAGLDHETPTLILWEGTTNYLSPDAVDATLRWCAQAPAGSQVIFTYIDQAVLDDPGRFYGADRVLSTVRRAGEPMVFGLDPADLAGYLAERGLTLTSDTGAADLRRQVYGEASTAMRGHEFYRLAHAVVPDLRQVGDGL